MVQITLGIECGHAAGGRRGAGLFVYLILHVAGSKNAGDAGLRGVALAAALGDELAVVHVQLAGE